MNDANIRASWCTSQVIPSASTRLSRSLDTPATTPRTSRARTDPATGTPVTSYGNTDSAQRNALSNSSGDDTVAVTHPLSRSR